MPLSQREMKRLEKIVALATKLLNKSSKSKTVASKAPAKRTRRSGKELVAFRKMLKAERKKGMPVAELAKIHSVTPAYIYQI